MYQVFLGYQLHCICGKYKTVEEPFSSFVVAQEVLEWEQDKIKWEQNKLKWEQESQIMKQKALQKEQNIQEKEQNVHQTVEQGKIEIAISLLKSGMSSEDVAKHSKIPLEDIESLSY